MALNIVNKINSNLKFLYSKNSFLTPALTRPLCNSLMQPHFDYACSTWYPNKTQNSNYSKQVNAFFLTVR